ncbi:MAG: hypothetical protein A2X66_00900 [Ignavibacteria bacterium GWA2_54_16]|nr:MAG: hypothetical protein A2X66_00900 [Ignavibacteria bacterium GWA2_54_16]
MSARNAALLAGMLLVSVIRTPAQELNCEITVNVDNITSGQRDYLRSFEGDIKKYLNNNRFTDEDLSGERIDCSMTVFFLSGSNDNKYSAQVVVVSQRPVYKDNDKSGKNTQVIRILDERWEFMYVTNQPMNKDEYRFDPLTSFLDYYANLIIGLDLETYNELAGARCFQRATNICNQAIATAYAVGWQAASAGTFSRFAFLEELTNMKYQAFRQSFHNYHFEGLDLLATQGQRGLDALLKAIEAIADMRQKQNPRSLLSKVFFDSKYLEIADVFLTWPDRDVYTRLSTADPAHQGTYDTYRRR